MKVIKDIRLYRSTIENIDGHAHPQEFASKELNCNIHRIVMKLREKGFTFENFDHLYLNFTTCTIEGKMALSKRTIDRYHPWYRYYDVEISQELFDMLNTRQCDNKIIEIVEQVLCNFFATPDFDSDKIQLCVSEAVTNGEKMIMKYKEKIASPNKVIIYLRYLDSGKYFPLLRVVDFEDNLILEKDLPETRSLDVIGTIQLSAKKVTIKPKKNAFFELYEAMSIDL